MTLYTYDFVNEGDVTGFRCLEQPFIWIDKEDMVSVLSAVGNWVFDEGQVILRYNPSGHCTSLAHYLLHYPKRDVLHINGNRLDFRKQNLVVSRQSPHPYAIRQTEKGSEHKQPLRLFDTPFSFTIFRQISIIGQLAIYPVSASDYAHFATKERSLADIARLRKDYENDTTYFHILHSCLPQDNALHSFILHFYKQFLFHLTIRNIHIRGTALSVHDDLADSLRPFFLPSQDEASILSVDTALFYRHLRTKKGGLR